ncbi:MAG: phospholipase D-like domain-containing protein [Patescibacteria group bacterium]
MLPNTPETTWKFYTTTHHAWEAMISAIRNAQTSIDLEQFNLAPDNIGKRFIEALIERAEAGVRVRLLVDAMGSVALGQSMYIEAMEQAGIEVRFFNWIFPFSKGNKRIWYFRDHRRTLIVDMKTAFTGGVCIVDWVRYWRETTLEITGNIIVQMQSPFELIWKKAHKKSLGMGDGAKTNLEGFTFLTQSPLPRQRHLYRRLIETIRHAQTYVFLTTPYFLPDRRLLRTLVAARRRGVDVRIIIPTNSDHPVVDRGSHTYFHRVLTAGIRLYRYRGMIHSKTAVIDGNWAMVGSLNLDNISLRYNFESGIVASNHHFASEVAGHFMNDIQNADELTFAQWQKRSYLSQFLELLVWPIRKFL